MSAADSDNPAPNLPAFKPRETVALSMQQREAVIERLTRSFADDALTMEEFERRAELAYRATSMADLMVLVSDLPVEAEASDVATKKGKSDSGNTIKNRITTILGNTERGMPGVMPRFLRLRTMLGNTELDFRQSTFEPGVTEVNVRCLMGNIELTVPEGVRVELHCSSVLANVGMNDLTHNDTMGDEVSRMLSMQPETRQPEVTGTDVSPVEVPGTGVATAGGSVPALGAAIGVSANIVPRERVLRVTGRAILANVEVHRGSLRREP